MTRIMDLKPGTKCFAKVKGYSPWPARIDVLPDDVKVPKGKYPVFFYGSHEVSYVTAKDIYDFEKFRPVYGIYKERNSKFNDAMLEIDNNPTIYQLGFDQRAVSFLSQFYKFDLSQSLENSTPISNIDVIDKKKPVRVSSTRRKRRHSHLINNNNKDQNEPNMKSLRLDLKNKKDQIRVTSPEENKSLPIEESSDNPSGKKIEVSLILKDVLTVIPSLKEVTELKTLSLKETEDGTKLVDNQETSVFSEQENFNILLNAFKSPIKASNTKRPRRSSSMQTFFKQNFVSFKSLSSNQRHGNKKPEISSRVKKDFDRIKKNELKHVSNSEEKITVKIESDIRSSPKHENVEIINNQSQTTIRINPTYSTNNKDENSLRIVSKLSIIDKEIKRNLVVGQENYDKCLTMMQSLLEITNISLVLLCRVPEIIVTIRKCRRYKKDEAIKSIASKIFYNFLQVYEQAQLEEKIEAGAELLKRDVNNCKSAQMLLDELFVIDKIQVMRQKVVSSLVLSSPSSAQSFHSSADNTPLLNTDLSNEASDIGVLLLDPDHININELIRNGILVLIESYSFSESNVGQIKKNESPTKINPLVDYLDIYKELGV